MAELVNKDTKAEKEADEYNFPKHGKKEGYIIHGYKSLVWQKTDGSQNVNIIC